MIAEVDTEMPILSAAEDGHFINDYRGLCWAKKDKKPRNFFQNVSRTIEETEDFPLSVCGGPNKRKILSGGNKRLTGGYNDFSRQKSQRCAR